MAKLHIREYTRLPVVYRTRADLPAAYEPAVTDQVVDFTTSTQSALFQNQTVMVRVAPVGGRAYVKFGENPTADANSAPIGDGQVEYFSVPPGGLVKVAAYDGSS